MHSPTVYSSLNVYWESIMILTIRTLIQLHINIKFVSSSKLDFKFFNVCIAAVW